MQDYIVLQRSTASSKKPTLHDTSTKVWYLQKHQLVGPGKKVLRGLKLSRLRSGHTFTDWTPD